MNNPPEAVLEQHDIGRVVSIEPAGGTAGRTWKITASNGTYFLRLRGVRTSTQERLEFDHGLRDHLIANGLPTAAALKTKTGDKWTRLEEQVFELYPFIEGRSHRSESLHEIENAARALARFHAVALRYTPPSREVIIPQYTTLGFSDETSDRMDDPRLQLANIRALSHLAAKPTEADPIDLCIERAHTLLDKYTGAAYDSLTGWIIHGDYTPANILFTESGEVAGIFDLDWSVPGARCRDVADGLYFFATHPREIDSSDIWSLTDAADFDLQRSVAFLRAYCEVSPLKSEETRAIPLAFAGRWLSIRLEGTAKVSPNDRFRFFIRDVEKPLRWLDAHWQKIEAALR